MLYSIDKGEYVKQLPHKSDYLRWRSNLSDEDYEKILTELQQRIDGDEVHTAGWMPGHDWTGTVFEPLYHACRRDVEQAAKFFGLILFKLMMERDDDWGFGRYQKDGVDIRSLTYFRIHR